MLFKPYFKLLFDELYHDIIFLKTFSPPKLLQQQQNKFITQTTKTKLYQNFQNIKFRHWFITFFNLFQLLFLHHCTIKRMVINSFTVLKGKKTDYLLTGTWVSKADPKDPIVTQLMQPRLVTSEFGLVSKYPSC